MPNNGYYNLQLSKKQEGAKSSKLTSSDAKPERSMPRNDTQDFACERSAKKSSTSNAR